MIRDVFGLESFRPGQRDWIEQVLAGRDCTTVTGVGSAKLRRYGSEFLAVLRQG